MRRVLNVRLPLRVAQKLAEYCAKRGITRSEMVVRALNRYLDDEAGTVNGYSIAVDLIPARGVKSLQADEMRELTRKSFRG